MICLIYKIKIKLLTISLKSDRNSPETFNTLTKYAIRFVDKNCYRNKMYFP